jgi:2-dehydro-3-deoxyglucarate aldolase
VSISNEFKKRLLAGETLIGSWCMAGSASIVETMGWTGFDFLTIDGEHGPYSPADILDSLRAIAGTPSLPVVRTPGHDATYIKRLLDIGAQTLLVPMVETADQAKAIVAATRYPPAGTRGFALMHRASRYLQVEDYAHVANDHICIVAQLESPGAIDRLEEIATVPGIDAVFIGPGDLSAAMGLLGQPTHEDVLSIMKEAASRCARIGVPCGTLFNRADVARRCLEFGYTMVAVGSDLAFLANSARALAQSMKQ